MLNYIIRRLLMVPFLLLGVSLLIFALLQFLSPTERSALYVRDFPRNPRAVAGVITRYKLDRPFYVQYWHWLVGYKMDTGEIEGGVLRGEFGYSRTASQPVSEMLQRRFPATLELTLWGVGPIILGAVLLGVLAAVNHNKFIDQFLRVVTIIGWSFPTFVFGLMVLMILYAQTGWFPPGRLSDWATQAIAAEGYRAYTHLVTLDSLLNLRFDIFLDALRHLFLPVVSLSYLSWALLLRVTRSSMLEVLRQEYITTARAKGLRERIVVNRHALPNALMPVVTIGGAQIVGLLGGVIITETIYNYPGIGSAYAAAATQLDVVTVLGFTLFTGAILVVANLIIDITYAYIDPRVRLD